GVGPGVGAAGVRVRVAGIPAAVQIREVDRQRGRAGAGSEKGERSGAAAAGEVVGRQVVYRGDELVLKTLFNPVALVVIEFRPLILPARADVPDFDGRVPGDRTLQPDRPRVRGRDLHVRMERLDGVRPVRRDWNRIGRRLRE